MAGVFVYMVNELLPVNNEGVIIRDKRGRFLPGTKSPAPITPETSRTMLARRAELRREVMRQAANEAVERGDLVVDYGDLAYAAEIMQAAQRKATNIDDPKMIDAARFVYKETGISEQDAERESVVHHIYSIDDDTKRALAEIANMQLDSD